MANGKRLGIPDHVPEAEAREDVRPLLYPVIEGFGPHRKTLYLGNLAAAEDSECLMDAAITETLNVSINIFPGPLILPDGVHVRRYQIGMIDGAGNSPYLMAAAVNTVQGLMSGYVPAKPHYPKHRNGHVLVHCRGGRSRSVTVIALWLSAFAGERFGSFRAALAHLRSCADWTKTIRCPPCWPLPKTCERATFSGSNQRPEAGHGRQVCFRIRCCPSGGRFPVGRLAHLYARCQRCAENTGTGDESGRRAWIPRQSSRPHAAQGTV
nr:hypothetical protein [Marinicella sp. W31]MDC2880215.1 hypothetical protein [Marinicella sp. W31]